MTDVVSRRDLIRLTKGMRRFPDIAGAHIHDAQKKNAQEAASYMQALVPSDEGKTKSKAVATAYRTRLAIGFAMTTSRPNKPGREADKLERIKAILFANDTDFFYSVWNLNKKRWKGRMRRAMNKSARQMAGAIK